MTRTRVTLRTAALLAAVLAAQAVVLELWSVGIWAAEFAPGTASGSPINAALLWELLIAVLHCAAFGLGVHLALRFFAPISVESTWRQTITRGIVATVSGAVVAFAFNAVVSLIAAITIGAYPFGYSFSAGLDASKVQYGIWGTIGTSLVPLIQWLPITLLAFVFLKLWLAAHPETESLREPALSAT